MVCPYSKAIYKLILCYRPYFIHNIVRSLFIYNLFVYNNNNNNNNNNDDDDNNNNGDNYSNSFKRSCKWS